MAGDAGGFEEMTSSEKTVASLAAEALESLRGKLQHSLSTEFRRCERNHLYTTLEDFKRADPSLRRVVVLGCTGAGKSSLTNVLGGWLFEQGPPDYEFAWKAKDGSAPLFNADVSAESVTQKVQFANLEWFGDGHRPFTAVDTPGHDDSGATELDNPASLAKLEELAADLHNMLRALGHIHLILVLHNDVTSGRLNPATYTVLKMVGEKFAKAQQNVWENVVIAFSKCNAHDVSWRSQLAKKKAAQQKAIRAKIPSCNVDVPILALGGGHMALADTSRSGGAEGEPRSRSRSRSPARPSAGSALRRRPSLSDLAAGAPDDFELLWRFLQDAAPLDTTRLQVFEGADRKFQRALAARDEAEARAKAALIYLGVVLRLAVLLVVFFWRSFLVPGWMSSFLLLNMPGPVDEIIYFAVFVYWVGPQDVLYSVRHFYRVWIAPKVKDVAEFVMPEKRD